MAEEEKEKTYYIRAMGEAVEVPKDLYLAYFKMRRQEMGLLERDRYNGTLHYNDLDTNETVGIEALADESASVEDAVVNKLMVEKLRTGISSLDETDRQLIQALFFDGLSERKLSQKTGIPHMTIHDCKMRVLEKLKKFLEN